MKYLLDNCYFKLRKSVRQIIEIPMGSDPVPFFAILFLFSSESKWIKKVKKSEMPERRFADVFRFIDDLNDLNDGQKFLKTQF